MSATNKRYFNGTEIANEEDHANTVSLLLDYAIDKGLYTQDRKQAETGAWKKAALELYDETSGVGYLSSFRPLSNNSGRAYIILRTQITNMIEELATKRVPMGRRWRPTTNNVMKAVKLYNDHNNAQKQKKKARKQQEVHVLQPTLDTTLDNAAVTNHGLRHQSLMSTYTSSEPNRAGADVTPTTTTTTTTTAPKDNARHGRDREMPEQAGPYTPHSTNTEVPVSAQQTMTVQMGRDSFRSGDSNRDQRRRTTDEGNYVTRTDIGDHVVGVDMNMDNDRMIDQHHATIVDDLAQGYNTIVNQSTCFDRIQTVVEDYPGRGTLLNLLLVTQIINRMDDAGGMEHTAERLVEASDVLTSRFLQEANIQLPPHHHNDNCNRMRIRNRNRNRNRIR